MVSSTVGSRTRTGWNLRSSALSFSIYFLYSSSVVAPIQWSSPRARAGLSILEASMDPSAAPAPTRVWISSMKRMISPAFSSTSLRTALSLSSNSPRYFAPAISDPMSSVMTCLFCMVEGTSPLMIRWASPSAIAVLPTPGSPIRMGLFLVLLERTWMIRRISSSRPITGSIFPCLAMSVRLRPYFSRAWYFSSGYWSVTLWLPRISESAWRKLFSSMPRFVRILWILLFLFLRDARKRCSWLTNSSCICWATVIEMSNKAFRFWEA